MPDNRPPDEDDGFAWEREESLFGARSRGAELPASPPPPGEVFSGPLFGNADPARPRSQGATSGRDVAHAGRDDATAARHHLDERNGASAADHLGDEVAVGDEAGGEGAGAGGSGTEGVSGGESRSDKTFPESGREAPRGRSSAGSFFRELPVLLLIAFVLAFLLRTFVLQVFYIPSSSMEPTLMVNDRMAVEKVTYLFREPRRGEVVVFEGEELGHIDPDASLLERTVQGVGQFLGVVPASARDLVKRVIGLPGDEILIEDGQVFVNGEPLDEPYVVYDDGSSYGPVTVPEDSLFFLGDNRPNSADSRRGLGMVPMEDVVGRSVVIIWPPGNMGSLTGVEHEVPDVP